MKSILSASVCAAVLAFAVPALAQTDTGSGATPTTTPGTSSTASTGSGKRAMHHHARHHGMSKGKMHGKGSKMSGDAAVQDLNAKSLAAARAGQTPDVGSGSASSPAAMPSTSTPSTSTSTGMAPSTGTPATTTPSNAPGGGQ